MLLSEEEVERLMRDSPAPFELDHAVLQFEEDNPPPVAPHSGSETSLPSQGPGLPTANRVRAGNPASRNRMPSRTRKSSPARWIFLAAAVASVAAAGVWLANSPPGSRSRSAPAAIPSGAIAAGESPDGPAVPADARVPAIPVSVDSPAAKDILISDGFDYPPGSELRGRSGGTGWSGPWSATRAVIARSSLVAGETAASSSGAHVSLTSPDLVTVARPYAATAAIPGLKAGEEWWISILISHTGGASGDGGDLWINCFSATTISAVARLTLTEKSGALQLFAEGHRNPLPIAGSPGAAVHIVARVKATRVSRGSFDCLMDVWANPARAAGMPAADFSMTVKGAPIPNDPGFSIRKLEQKSPGTVRLDSLVIARSAAGVMP